MRSRFRAMIAILFSGLLAGCEGDGTVDSSPTSPSLFTGSIPAGGYELVRTSIGGSGPKIAGLIGILGGTVTGGGHSLTIPAGAVLGPTLFAITPLRTGFIEVDLAALVLVVPGPPLEVGHLGFQNGKRVQLTLSYADATNVDDPSDLVILRVFADGSAEPLPTVVDAGAESVSTELDHFSRYAMAID